MFLVRFFTHHADMIGLVSFNLQAGTGRGKWGSRSNLINQFSWRAQVDAGTQTALPWGVVQVGHGDCHSYMPTLVVDGRAHAAFRDSQFFGDLLRDFGSVDADRHSSPAALVGRYLLALARRPRWWPRMLSYGLVLLKAMGGGLLRARGRVYKLTVFIQNFMDAENLDEDRLHACSFMVITADGPVPMCEHNTHRDDYILKPLDVPQPNGRVEHYEPLVWTESNRREIGRASCRERV